MNGDVKLAGSSGVTTLGMLRRAAPSTLYSLADQAAVSSANLLISLWLARHLIPVEYSAFTIAYGAFLLAGIVHSALVTEPMLVYMNSRFKDQADAYLRRVFLGNWIAGVGLCAPLAVGAGIAVLTRSDLAGPLVAFSVAGPFVLFHWTARRACYGMARPAVAARFDLVYLLVVAIASMMAGSQGWLSAETGSLIMGAGSALAGWLTWRELSPRAVHTTTIDGKEVRVSHWSFGRWLIGSGGLRWLQSNALVMISPVFLGLTAAGELRVLGLVLMPMSQALTAVGPLLSPMFTRARDTGLLRTLGPVLGALILVTLSYFAFVAMFGESIIGIAFGDRYLHLAPLLVIYGLAPVFSAIAAVAGAGLHSVLRTDALFWAAGIAALVAVAGALFVVPSFGLAGAVATDVASTAALAVVLAFALYGVVGRET